MKKLVTILAGSALTLSLIAAPAVASPQPTVLLSVSGTSSTTLPPFTVPASAGHWRLSITYSCPPNAIFVVDVWNTYNNDNVATWSLTAPSATRTWTVNQTGTYKAVVTTYCKWSLSATAVIPTAAPGIGATAVIPALPGAYGSYSVT
ncbi:MAG: hypothetical protein ACLQVK_05230, partial [Acidimicrobiales bacterium]